MKKLMIVAAAAMGLAAFGDIESVNVVGYATTPSSIGANKFTLGTASFEGIGGDGEIKVSNLVSTTAKPGVYDTMLTDAPQLQVWNGTGYDMYYYITDAGDNADEEGWSDEMGYIATGSVPCGTGYWYKVPGEDTSFTLAGQVLADATVTMEVKANHFDLIGNPFPTALELKNVTTTLEPGIYDEMLTGGTPQLQIWNGTGYAMYYYISDAGDDANETGWSDESGYIAEGVVADPTKGMWLKAPNAGTITFTK